MSAQDNLSKKEFVTVKHDNETRIAHTNKKGKVKYYSTHGSAWNAAIRLNDKGHKPKGVDYKGSWLFEGDTNGWYLYYDKD